MLSTPLNHPARILLKAVLMVVSFSVGLTTINLKGSSSLTKGSPLPSNKSSGIWLVIKIMLSSWSNSKFFAARLNLPIPANDFPLGNSLVTKYWCKGIYKSFQCNARMLFQDNSTIFFLSTAGTNHRSLILGHWYLLDCSGLKNPNEPDCRLPYYLF